MAPSDILVSDVGAHKLWLGRLFPAYEPNTVIVSNGFATMGIGLPGAIAATPRAARAARRVGVGRRRVPDERAGDGDRDPSRRAGHRGRLGGRRLRGDRLEAGAPLRPHPRHRLRQPRLRRAGARLRLEPPPRHRRGRPWPRRSRGPSRRTAPRSSRCRSTTARTSAWPTSGSRRWGVSLGTTATGVSRLGRSSVSKAALQEQALVVAAPRGWRRPARGSRTTRCGGAWEPRHRGPRSRAIAAACAPPIVGPPPTGRKRRSGRPITAACSGRSSLCPKSPKWQTRTPWRSKATIRFGPRRVPAASSCSEAIPRTGPTGVVKVPAVERTRCGSPPADSTPLWSGCSCVTTSRSAGRSRSTG